MLLKEIGKCERELAAVEAQVPDTAATSEDDAPAAPSSSSSSAPAVEKVRVDNSPPPVLSSGAKYVPIESFGWDQSNKNVSVYVSNLAGVGKNKDNVTCDFTSSSFDLRVHDLDGKSYRLTKGNLDKEIDPKKSKIKVKSDRITILLRKVDEQYGPAHWTDLVAKRAKKSGKKDDPMSGIMDLMKDMYDSGDDKMKETIGKAMMNARSGNASEPEMPKFDDNFSV